MPEAEVQFPYLSPLTRPEIAPSYLVFIDSADGLIKAKNGRTGVIEFQGVDAATVINSAITSLPAAGGKVFVRAGIYTLNSTIAIDRNDVTLEGENWGSGSYLVANTNNMAIITLGSNGNFRYYLTLKCLRTAVSSGVSGVTGILQWNLAYSHFETLMITGSNTANQLQTGWQIKQETIHAGRHSYDNTMFASRIVNFYGVGLRVEDWEDTEFTAFNIGTQNANATDCIKVESPNAGQNAGGGGVNVSQGHLWGDAANTAYGLNLSSINNGTFGTRWANIVIEAVVTGGIRLGGLNVHSHDFVNIRFAGGITKAISIIDSAVGGAASNNQFYNLTNGILGQGTYEWEFETGDFGVAWAGYVPAGYAWNGRKVVAYNSNAGVLASRLYVYTNGAWRMVAVA